MRTWVDTLAVFPGEYQAKLVDVDVLSARVFVRFVFKILDVGLHHGIMKSLRCTYAEETGTELEWKLSDLVGHVRVPGKVAELEGKVFQIVVKDKASGKGSYIADVKPIE
jgi:hypothetical protein